MYLPLYCLSYMYYSLPDHRPFNTHILMITIEQYEKAASQRAFIITQILRNKENLIYKILGNVFYMKKEAGQYVRHSKNVKWTSEGRCFSRHGVRLRRYDLDLE